MDFSLAVGGWGARGRVRCLDGLEVEMSELVQVHTGLSPLAVYWKDVTEVVLRRGATSSDLRIALGGVDPQAPLIDFSLDETGDTVYLLFGGERV